MMVTDRYVLCCVMKLHFYTCKTLFCWLWDIMLIIVLYNCIALFHLLNTSNCEGLSFVIIVTIGV